MTMVAFLDPHRPYNIILVLKACGCHYSSSGTHHPNTEHHF